MRKSVAMKISARVTRDRRLLRCEQNPTNIPRRHWGQRHSLLPRYAQPQEQLRELLYRLGPKLKDDQRMPKRAGVWSRLNHLILLSTRHSATAQHQGPLQCHRLERVTMKQCHNLCLGEADSVGGLGGSRSARCTAQAPEFSRLA